MARPPKPTVTIASLQKDLRVPRKRIEELVRFVARRRKIALADVDVAVVDGRRMSRLNRRWLGRSGTTDVISFDLTGDADRGITAQIIVCATVARREAERRGIGPQRELLLYVLHGLLHVAGLDDRTPTQRKRMEACQVSLLAAFVAGESSAARR